MPSRDKGQKRRLEQVVQSTTPDVVEAPDDLGVFIVSDEDVAEALGPLKESELALSPETEVLEAPDDLGVFIVSDEDVAEALGPVEGPDLIPEASPSLTPGEELRQLIAEAEAELQREREQAAAETANQIQEEIAPSEPAEIFEEGNTAQEVSETTVPSDSLTGVLPLQTVEEYVNKISEAMKLPVMRHTQRATFERLLQDENSLLRMWCDGHFDDWEKEAKKKPPVLTSGVLPNPEITLGMDWELPFGKDIDPSFRYRGLFSEAFKARLEERGVPVHQGHFKKDQTWIPEDNSPPPLCEYNDVHSIEYGSAVMQDDPEGWGYFERVFGALNDLNQGEVSSQVPQGYAQAERGCVEDLLTPIPGKGRWTSGWHIHIGHPKAKVKVEMSDEEKKSERNVAALAYLTELPIYRLGQHKKFGWRKSKYTKPMSKELHLSSPSSLGSSGSQMYHSQTKTGTFEFRPNDTYVKTNDTEASLRRFQAQAAFYGGLVELATKSIEGNDYSVLGEGNGLGLPVGFAFRRKDRKLTEKVHFLTALDLVAKRQAKTKDGQNFDLRKLLYYEWVTSKPVTEKPVYWNLRRKPISDSGKKG